MSFTDPSGFLTSTVCTVEEGYSPRCTITVDNDDYLRRLYDLMQRIQDQLASLANIADVIGDVANVAMPGEKDEAKQQCKGPPPAPGTGQSQGDLTKKVSANGNKAAAHFLDPLGLLWFRNQVRNNAPWDYKQANRGFQDFGNYNYGYTGTAAGISGNFLLQRAGAAQIAAGTSKPNWGEPGFLSMFGGDPPYGDDPNDQEMIKQGMADRANGC